MSLILIWKSNPEVVSAYRLEQVVSSAGDGNLKDNSPCSTELREYFSMIQSEKLFTYVDECLNAKFDKSGLVLQELVNELGRRLDFEVTNGRYQGVQNSIGYDGIWHSPDGHTLVVEVKTTDAYRISLDTIAKYRQRLVEEQTISTRSSILIVVGRQDTGELESQVRGSRHAWDVRLISAESLSKLVRLKESSDEIQTGQKIRSLLNPFEYTRVDELVDVLFTTVADVEAGAATDDGSMHVDENDIAETDVATRTWEFTDSDTLQSKRDDIIASVSSEKGVSFIKKTRALYWSSDRASRIVCTVSKRYVNRPTVRYWYAYHPKWDEFLVEGSDAYLVLGCMDLDKAFVIPRSIIAPILKKLNTTTTERGMYWHLHLVDGPDGELEIRITNDENLRLKPFEHPIKRFSTSA